MKQCPRRPGLARPRPWLPSWMSGKSHAASPRPDLRLRRDSAVLPLGADLAVEDQNQGGAPAAQRGRTTLIVIFARRHNARRGEDGPATGAGAVTAGCVTA